MMKQKSSHDEDQEVVPVAKKPRYDQSLHEADQQWKDGRDDHNLPSHHHQRQDEAQSRTQPQQQFGGGVGLSFTSLLRPAHGENLRQVFTMLNSSHSSENYRGLTKLTAEINFLEANSEKRISYILPTHLESSNATDHESILSQLVSSSLDPLVFDALLERSSWFIPGNQPLEPLLPRSSKLTGTHHLQLQKTDYQEGKAARARLQSESLLFEFLTASPEAVEVMQLWDTHVSTSSCLFISLFPALFSLPFFSFLPLSHLLPSGFFI
jgi:hypothetical protein